MKIPVIPKMTPNIAHISQPAMGAYFAGADAISAINTIKSVTLGEGSEVSGCQTGSGYSGKAVKPIALRHILAMAKNPIMKNIQFSGIGGIENWKDALEFIQLGCRNVQICTAVMQYGYRIIDDLITGLQTYMAERDIENVEDFVGELLPKFYLPSNLDRDTIVFPKIDYERCIGCGRCYISCQDSGHQAITPSTRKHANPELSARNASVAIFAASYVPLPPLVWPNGSRSDDILFVPFSQGHISKLQKRCIQLDAPLYDKILEICSEVLDLDFHLNTAGEFELHQSVDSLGGRAVDVDEALVVRELELLAGLLVNERTAVHGVDALVGGEGNRTAHNGAGSLHCLHNLLG